MFRSVAEIRVRYEETDKMGVVYHAKYFNWFEVARIQLLDEVNQPYRELEEKGFLLPVLSCEAKFKRPAHFDDKLEIEVIATFPSPVKLKAGYRVFRGNDEIAVGETTHAFVSREGRIVRPPPSFLRLIEGLPR